MKFRIFNNCNLRYKGYLLLIASVLTSCMQDYVDGESCFQQEDKTQLVLSIGNLTDIQTYSEGSTNECYINDNLSDGDHYYDLYLLVFDSDGNYKSGEAIEKNNVDANNGNNLRTAVVPMMTVGDKFVILINTGISQSSETQGLAALHPGTSTDADINTAFPSNAWSINQQTDNSGKGMPMSSALVTFNLTGTASTINIYRSVAKIQLSVSSSVELASGITNFDDNSVTWAMTNDATQGAIYSNSPQKTGATVIPTSNSFHTLADEDFTHYGISYAGSLDEKVYYLPEYRSSTLAMGTTVDSTKFTKDRPCMILKHNNKYYRIDLIQKHTDGTYKYLDIKRNCHYTVNITKVMSEGYTYKEEVLYNPPSNLEYEIIVTEENDNVIVSNGQYAIALECDTLIACADENTEISFKARAILGTGITSLLPINYIEPDSQYNITLTGTSTLSSNEQDIKFIMRWDIGTLTFHFGNITRTVYIQREDPLDAHYDHKTIEGNFSDIKWTNTDDNINITVNGTSSITINTGENITPTNASALTDPTVEPVFENKKVEGYAITDIGCKKILILQNAPEYIGWAGGDTDISSDTYYSKMLVAESVEEGRWTGTEWTGNNYMQWATTNDITGVQDREKGKTNTKALNTSTYPAAYACWMKNDANRDGTVTDDEFNAAGWYLPAQNQLLHICVSMPNFNSILSGRSYWSSTESVYEPSLRALGELFSRGSSGYYPKDNTLGNRCVREITPTGTLTQMPQQVRTENDYAVIDCTYLPAKTRRSNTYLSGALPSHSELSSKYNNVAYTKFAVSHKNINKNGVEEDSIRLNHDDAISACNAYGGPSGNENGLWRLPTQRELILMWILKSSLESQPNFTRFSLLYVSYYSATKVQDAQSSFWTVTMANGNMSSSSNTINHYVRCVREFNE